MNFILLLKRICQKIVLYWQTILISLGLSVLLGLGIFIRGCQYGEERMDAKWKSQLATSKPVEVRRDTTVELKPQPVSTGRLAVGQILTPGPDYQKAIDSLKTLIEAKTVLIEDLLAPHKTVIESPAIGKLEVTYWPAWKHLTYVHFPPPIKITTVTIEKERVVIAPKTFWETIDAPVAAVATAVLTYLLIKAVH